MELCRPEMTPCQHLETQQALVKQFAEILEFTLKFDELKVRNIYFVIHLRSIVHLLLFCMKPSPILHKLLPF